MFHNEDFDELNFLQMGRRLWLGEGLSSVSVGGRAV